MQTTRLAGRALGASLLVFLGACSTIPSAPSILALPGTNRTFDAFRADDQACRQYASQQITIPVADPGVKSAVVGTAVGAAAGAAIGGQQGAAVGAGTGLLMGSAVGADSNREYTYGTQRQYDHAYIQCMYGRGHKVPVSAEFAKNLSQSPPVAPARSGNYPPPPSTEPPPDYVPPR